MSDREQKARKPYRPTLWGGSLPHVWYSVLFRWYCDVVIQGVHSGILFVPCAAGLGGHVSFVAWSRGQWGSLSQPHIYGPWLGHWLLFVADELRSCNLQFSLGLSPGPFDSFAFLPYTFSPNSNPFRGAKIDLQSRPSQNYASKSHAHTLRSEDSNRGTRWVSQPYRCVLRNKQFQFREYVFDGCRVGLFLAVKHGLQVMWAMQTIIYNNPIFAFSSFL